MDRCFKRLRITAYRILSPLNYKLYLLAPT